MQKYSTTGVMLLLSGIAGMLSGCTIVDVKTMTNKELTECAASAETLRNAVACSEELENRNATKPKSQYRPENRKVLRVVDLHEQGNNGRMQAGA